MTDQKKLEIRFLVRTPISYIRRGPPPSLACDSMRGTSLRVHTQARPPGPALAAAPEAHLVRRLGAAGPAVRDEEGGPAEGRRHRRADRAGLVVAEAYGPAGRASVQVVMNWHRHAIEQASRRWRGGGATNPRRISLIVVIPHVLLRTAPPRRRRRDACSGPARAIIRGRGWEEAPGVSHPYARLVPFGRRLWRPY